MKNFERFCGINFRGKGQKDFAEKAKKTRNRKSFWPRKFLTIKYIKGRNFEISKKVSKMYFRCRNFRVEKLSRKEKCAKFCAFRVDKLPQMGPIGKLRVDKLLRMDPTLKFRAWKMFSIKYRGRYFFLQECTII